MSLFPQNPRIEKSLCEVHFSFTYLSRICESPPAAAAGMEEHVILLTLPLDELVESRAHSAKVTGSTSN